MNVKQKIEQKAKSLGFLSFGVSKATFLEEEAPRLEQFLSRDYCGEMNYMRNHFDKRLDPRLLVEGAKSVISLTYNYYPKKKQKENTYKISKYAYGEDYHHVVKEKLKLLMTYINDEIAEVNGRAFVDSAPVLEKAWAVKSGLGWQGKNGNVITKNEGSFYFLAELIIDLSLPVDEPVRDYCGTCKKCIEACPTKAIVEPYIVDGSRCISYFTIELKEDIPSGYNFNDWIFGCDICQDVCPWNRFSKPHQEKAFEPLTDLIQYQKEDWREITQEVFSEIFKKSAVKRTKYKGLMRNIKYISNQN